MSKKEKEVQIAKDITAGPSERTIDGEKYSLERVYITKEEATRTAKGTKMLFPEESVRVAPVKVKKEKGAFGVYLKTEHIAEQEKKDRKEREEREKKERKEHEKKEKHFKSKAHELIKKEACEKKEKKGR
jgi:hypothetical protein